MSTNSKKKKFLKKQNKISSEFIKYQTFKELECRCCVAKKLNWRLNFILITNEWEKNKIP